ncbi:saccharopine dehydrogenase NADP-binding domain-containing protein [Candidatus Pacearchaeota archaeon]|nr:saccharopine dehydrogenase NADP-binding domain-containing protein [Candidatus Pacearchaeota archaeon]MBI2056635.1 saccharopine dehydrogenase NADP-binding domain-containing protein [Candidatus Pacearchaeota archaeon]
MLFDFVVLGATGEEGNITSKDLLESGYSVLLCGRNKSRIKTLLKYKKAKFAYVDLNNIEKTAGILKKSGAKIAVNCAELRMNINAMKACLISGLHYLDLGGLQEMTIQQYKFDKDFKKRKLTALLGCGSTPGISNVMAAYAVNKMDSVEHIEVGFAWDSNIKKFILPYSIESIVHELTTDPIVLDNGKFKKTKACTFEGALKFREIKKQNTYCIVHSEVFTFKRYFGKKGLKFVHYKAGFPEHSFKVLDAIIKLGFGSKEPININGINLRPIDFTREVLKKIDRPKGYKETEDIWIKVYGKYGGRPKKIEMDCLVKTLKGWEDVGSNINTGMSISIMAQMLNKNLIKKEGITAPEEAVPCKSFFEELAKRKMYIYENNKRIN